MPNKRALIELILSQLHRELDNLTQSAKAAHEAATHEESKAEDSHDTRGLEASYLAGAQMARIEMLKKMIQTFQLHEIRNFGPQDPVALGALVQLDLDGKEIHSFVMPQGGGISVQTAQKTIQVITPQSPLGEALLGRRVGEVVEVEAQKTTREYEIISIS